MAFCSVHPAGISNSRARPATCSSFTPRFSPASTPARQCKPGERNPPKCIAGLVNTTSKFAVDPKLIATAFSATSKLFVTTLIGVIAAAKGLLDKTTLQVCFDSPPVCILSALHAVFSVLFCMLRCILLRRISVLTPRFASFSPP